MENKCQPTPFIITNPLLPVGPASQLFISGASIFEITIFEPPIQRVTIIGVNLPEPDTFGPYTQYVATLVAPDDPTPIAEISLLPTADNQVWAGTTLLTFGGTLFPINVEIRPILPDERIGPVILEGPVFN